MDTNLKVDPLALLAVNNLMAKNGFNKDWKPKFAVILGSGLGGLAKEIKNPHRLSFKEAWNWINSDNQVPGHDKEIVVGQLFGHDMLAFSGRIHCYEGYTPQQSVQPVLLAHALGAKFILLTNAAGGLSDAARMACPMVITDQLKLSDATPLRGPNNDALGARFLDVSQVYNNQYTKALYQAQTEAGFPNSSGTYMYMAGPQYETKAEVRALRVLGADAVGMSTVFEAITAAWLKLPVAAFSLITNVAGGFNDQPVEHEEVEAVGAESGPKLIQFVKRFLANCRSAQLI